MIKKYHITIALALCIISFIGCEREHSEKGQSNVVIYFTTQSLSASLLKMAATEEEEAITKVILYAVDEEDDIIQTHTIDNPSLNGIPLTIPTEVKWFYAIANPSIELEEETPENVADLLDLTESFTTAPLSPFMMSGIGEVSSISVIIPLVRSIARVDIIGKNGFHIDSVKVIGTPNKGYVFKRESLLSLPASADTVSYAAVERTNSDTITLYVAENIASNPTKFIVSGEYENLQTCDTILIKYEGYTVDIMRNTCYQLGVTPVSE